ncbi:putative Ig domain-containing protein [Agromyces aerolatus]|uniref:putative Ig domain-containing protein n=1 Tax=Agromyces sp. LY-1074 TaxID=3074080 RepID=UPI0028622514|nr:MULTISPECIES: putative Ig domain-containing protein [unclassified Agromyces]MDR5698773.1 putative Ig domain-containing protein [Agromyces sp. LY-1074]MDR5705067.1 putative Ig domain-containing protein [Agromyces sp. LY-1358]
MFSLRSGSASILAALLIATPLHASTASGAAEPDITSQACLARVGVPVACQVADVGGTDAFGAGARAADPEGAGAEDSAPQATGLPPGLVISGDGRISGTPTQPGISTVTLTIDGRPAASVPVVVSNVDYMAVTMSADAKTLRGTRWDGSHTVLHEQLYGSDVRDLGIHPDGSVYVLTRRTLLRIEGPGLVSVVVEGLESEAMDIASNGDIHIATRNEVLTIRADGRAVNRLRGVKVWDVVADDAGNLWTIEFVSGARVVRHIDVGTGVVRPQAAGADPISIAANRGYVYVSTAPVLGEPHRVVAIGPDGASSTVMPERHLRVDYSDAYGLLATEPDASSQRAWAAPLQRSDLADPTFSKIAVAKHLRFTGVPPARALVDEFDVGYGRVVPGDVIGSVRPAYGTHAWWSMPGGTPQHGVSVSPQGVLTAVEGLRLGRHTLLIEAQMDGVTQLVPVVVNCA